MVHITYKKDSQYVMTVALPTDKCSNTHRASSIQLVVSYDTAGPARLFLLGAASSPSVWMSKSSSNNTPDSTS